MLLRDVAEVRIGAAPPEGATLRNGETVSGMVIMLKGENGKQLIERVKERIASLRLPPGVKIIPFYDQSFVIDGTIHTVEKNLFEGFILVTVVLLLFLGNLRAALITAADHSVFHADQFSGHAAVRHQRQSDEPGRDRFRHDRRRRGGDDGELRPSPGREARRGVAAGIGAPRGA